MKIVYRRTHTVRPVNYESVQHVAQVEIDTDSESDFDQQFVRDAPDEIGTELAEYVDGLLATDVDRTLRLDGEHINDSHLWAFYGLD